MATVSTGALSTPGNYSVTLVSATVDGCTTTFDSDNTASLTITPASLWYPDADNDGFGDDAATGVAACTAPIGTVADSTDCDDNDNTSFPGANDICNDGIDQDCNGSDAANGSTCVRPTIIGRTVNGCSVTFNWNEGCYKRFRLQYRTIAPVSPWALILLPKTTTSHTATLLPNTTYQWGLRGECFSNNQWSLVQAGTNFTTLACNVTSLVANPGSVSVNDATAHVVAYPNPVRDVLHVDVFTPQTSATVAFRLHDQLGRVLYQETVSTSGAIKHHINMADLTPGIYYLHTTPEGQAPIVKPVVFER